MTKKVQQSKRLLLTSEALAGYQALIEPGERILSAPQDDPSLVEEVQAEQDKLQEEIDQIEERMQPTVEEHRATTKRRAFWSNEMNRLSETLKRGTIVVNQYDVDADWNEDSPRIVDTRVYRVKTREDAKKAKRAVDSIKRKLILPELRAERKAAKELAAKLAPFEERKRVLTSQIEEWGQYYTDPDQHSKEYVRFARYWRDFLKTVKKGGPHYKPLSNIPANPPLIRYRRAKLRIIFRRVGNAIHVLRIARRGDDTYSNLDSVITESDRHL